MRKTYRIKKVLCEECMSDFNFNIEDIFWDESMFDYGEYDYYLICPYCGGKNQLFNLSDYGVNEDDIIKDQSRDWETY